VGLERPRLAERNSQGPVPGWTGWRLNSSDNLRHVRDLRLPNPRVRYELPGDAAVGTSGPLDLTIRPLVRSGRPRKEQTLRPCLFASSVRPMDHPGLGYVTCGTDG